MVNGKLIFIFLRISELEYEANATSTKEDAESLVWNNMIVPFLEELESGAAGSLLCAIQENKLQTHNMHYI